MNKLETCPFCGCTMKVWEEDGIIDQLDHPTNDCILTDFEFPGSDVEAWNKRA